MDYDEAREIIKRVGKLNRESEELRKWINRDAWGALRHLYELVRDEDGSKTGYPSIENMAVKAAKAEAKDLRGSIEEEIEELKSRLNK